MAKENVRSDETPEPAPLDYRSHYAAANPGLPAPSYPSYPMPMPQRQWSTGQWLMLSAGAVAFGCAGYWFYNAMKKRQQQKLASNPPRQIVAERPAGAPSFAVVPQAA